MSPESLLGIGGILTVVALVGGAAWWRVRRHNRQLWDKIAVLQSRCKFVKGRLDRARDRVRNNKARSSIQGERIRALEKQFEEALADKEKLRQQGFQYEARLNKLRKLANQLYQDKREFEEQFRNQTAELYMHVRTSREQQETLAALERQLAELREAGGIDPNLAQAILTKDQAIARLQEDARLLAEQAQKKDAALESLRQASRLQGEKIQTLLDELEDLARQHQEQGVALDQKIRAAEEAHQQAAALQKQLATFQDEYQRLLAMTAEEPGRIWERPALAGSPPFVPRADRTMPIISVINLKGGVGKTTLTANLAAILGVRGKRVLVIDLDYQRSLTRLCLADAAIKTLHEQQRTLQDFLLHPQADGGQLLNCAFPLRGLDGCDIMINGEALEVKQAADSLEDAEMYLQARWLVNPAGRDVRFLLRQALHAPAVRTRYDYVLLDCPPRLTTACINALAASDFALIPVMLDKVSSVSAPNLLRKLNQLRAKKVLAPLAILGVVANRVRLSGGQPIKLQAAEWNELQTPCKEAWGQAIHFFAAKIKESPHFAQAAYKQTYAAFSGELKPIFTDLVTEIEARISHESKRPATVPA